MCGAYITQVETMFGEPNLVTAQYFQTTDFTSRNTTSKERVDSLHLRYLLSSFFQR